MRSREADLLGRIGDDGAELPLAGVEWPIGGFWGVVGATPVFIVRGGNVFTGDDSRDVSDKSVVSLTYPSSNSLELVAVARCCC